MSQARKRRTRPRAKTTNRKQLARERLAGPVLPVVTERPRTRSECPTARPCPWVGCKYHLYLDVNPQTGSLKINFPDLEPWELAETCTLDVAERAGNRGMVFEDIGELMNISRERVRQLELRILAGLRKEWTATRSSMSTSMRLAVVQAAESVA